MRPSGTSHCHPIQSSVKPCRISAPLPNSASRRRIRGVRGVLEDRQDPLRAAIAGFVEQPAVAARGIDRLQQVEVGGELDEALRILRREIEIDDAAVLRQRRIEREVDFARELFVRPRGAERLAVEDDLAPFDPEPGHARGGVQRAEENGDQGQRRGPQHPQSIEGVDSERWRQGLTMKAIRRALVVGWLVSYGCGTIPGQDVRYEPTPMPVVRALLELAAVGPQDVVYDLGSGDGRIPITAATEFGARGVGIEIDPALVTLAQAKAREAGVEDKVEFRLGDMYAADVRPATVVTLFLHPGPNLKLREKLRSDLRPGSRVVFVPSGTWVVGRRRSFAASTSIGSSCGGSRPVEVAVVHWPVGTRRRSSSRKFSTRFEMRLFSLPR